VPDPRRPRRAFASRWTTDPDYATAYSYLRPGGTPADRDALGEPIAPGLVLAGEATWSAHPGTMHGAWFSGERAARRLLEGGAPRRALVVGAGLAGLAAARTLAEAGVPTTVLEASHALGGRAATDRSLGGPVHTGAAWLHGDEGNPIAAAVRHAGIPLEPSRWDATATFVAGHGALDEGVERRVAEARTRIDAAVHAAQHEASIDRPLGPLLRDLLDGVALPSPEHAVLERWVVGIYENLYAAPIDDLSLVYADEPFRLPGPDLTLLDGIDSAISRLAEGLDVRFGARVTRIAVDGSSWRAGTAEREHEGEAVVVTVPIGVLKGGRVAFDPPLPNRITAALSRLGAGVVTKAFFTFDAPFWGERWSFSTVADSRPPFELWVDVSRLAGIPTLCAFATHTRAREIEGLAEHALCELAYQTLSASVPTGHPD
jgi:polyamine oxidase